MSEQETRAVVDRYSREVTQERNLAAAEELIAADAILHESGGKTIQGIEAYRARNKGLMESFPDFRYTTEFSLVEGEMAAVRYTFRGTHLGTYGGIPPTGKEVTFAGVSLYRVAGGKIVEAWSHTDTASMLRQLGATIVPPGQVGR